MDQVENCHEIIYASQHKSDPRTRKKWQERPGDRGTEEDNTSESTQPVAITLTPLQTLPISAFLQAHQSFSKLPLV